MFGLGKPRTVFGEFLDREGISQTWLVNNAGVNRDTVTRLCNDRDYSPNTSTVTKVISTLRKNRFDVEFSDFWD